MRCGLLALGVIPAALIGCGSTGTGSDARQSASATTGAGAAGTGGGGNTPTGAGPGSSTSGSAPGSGGAGGGAAGGPPGAWCTPPPACDAPPPDPGAAVGWNHTTSSLIVASGSPNHRGRDLFVSPGDAEWVIGKFSYGVADKDLKDEQVDVWLLRDCASSWEKLGSALTTYDDTHPPEEGVDDSGGRIYFEIPADKALGPGRHRVHLVVRGDLSSTDLFIEVVPKGAPVVVTDVDGTLTTSENAEFGALLTGSLPDPHPDAAAGLGLLQAKGYHLFYLSGRPEWLVGRTREFLDANGFPPGIVHTTVWLTGATGQTAATFKADELALLAKSKGMVPAWSFGNTDTDGQAYDAAGIAPVDLRIFFQFDDTFGGRRIEAYTDLLGELGALPTLCP